MTAAQGSAARDERPPDDERERAELIARLRFVMGVGPAEMFPHHPLPLAPFRDTEKETTDER